MSLCVMFVAARALQAEQAKRASPHEQASAVIDGKKITIEYGRPFKKGREIFGKLVPFGEVWRTGADEATILTVDAAVTLGDLKVAKGTYSLFTLPTQKEFTLIINKAAKQWGAYSYDAKQDLGRAKMTVSAAPAAVEQLTITLEATGGKKGVLKIAWDKTVASIPVTVD
jgi:hypothetical protein